MKTVIEQVFEKHDNSFDKMDFLRWLSSNRKDLLKTEKEQQEKTSIDMINIALDNLNNPDCKMEEEFNKYYDKTFNK